MRKEPSRTFVNPVKTFVRLIITFVAAQKKVITVQQSEALVTLTYNDEITSPARSIQTET